MTPGEQRGKQTRVILLSGMTALFVVALAVWVTVIVVQLDSGNAATANIDLWADESGQRVYVLTQREATELDLSIGLPRTVRRVHVTLYALDALTGQVHARHSLVNGEDQSTIILGFAYRLLWTWRAGRLEAFAEDSLELKTTSDALTENDPALSAILPREELGFGVSLSLAMPVLQTIDGDFYGVTEALTLRRLEDGERLALKREMRRKIGRRVLTTRENGRAQYWSDGIGVNAVKNGSSVFALSGEEDVQVPHGEMLSVKRLDARSGPLTLYATGSADPDRNFEVMSNSWKQIIPSTLNRATFLVDTRLANDYISHPRHEGTGWWLDDPPSALLFHQTTAEDSGSWLVSRVADAVILWQADTKLLSISSYLSLKDAVVIRGSKQRNAPRPEDFVFLSLRDGGLHTISVHQLGSDVAQ